jgi:uncharacterized protein (TIGR02996 family)
MTDGPALLRNIVANPDDDTARLVYADWLDESGDADRAEFVRGQVRLAQMRPHDDGFTALDVRCRRLEDAHPEWREGLPDEFVERRERFCGPRVQPFERGFLARARLLPKQYVQNRPLFDRNPVSNVRFNVGEAAGAAWLKQRALARLRGAEFAYARDPDRVADILAGLNVLSPLDHFGVLACEFDAKAADAIFNHPNVAGVRSLLIGGTRLDAESERVIASAAWPSLRKLARVWIHDAEWLRAPFIRRLHELTVSDTEPNLDPARRGVLAEVLPETDIHTLELGWWELDAAGGRTLAAALAKSKVESFALGQTGTRLDVANALIVPEALVNLRALYLSWAELDADVISRLAGSELRVLALDHVSRRALGGLTKAPGMPHLADLRLGLVRQSADDILGDRLRAVLDAGTLPNLVSLTVCETTPHRGDYRKPPGDELAEAVAASASMANLRELQLAEAVTMTGAKALANSPHLAGLQRLTARVWPKDESAEQLLKERFGSVVTLDIISREF